ERVAVHARQLAFEPDLQIIRRSRRPLLRGLEQARRPALAHHVYRIASMGARVLINGTRYNSNKILPTGDTQVDSRTLAASARTASRRACDRLGIARRRQSRRVRSRSIGRFLFTVPNLPTGWPARYRIATPTLICCV